VPVSLLKLFVYTGEHIYGEHVFDIKGTIYEKEKGARDFMKKVKEILKKEKL
jgi:hypothetical protein